MSSPPGRRYGRRTQKQCAFSWSLIGLIPILLVVHSTEYPTKPLLGPNSKHCSVIRTDYGVQSTYIHGFHGFHGFMGVEERIHTQLPLKGSSCESAANLHLCYSTLVHNLVSDCKLGRRCEMRKKKKAERDFMAAKTTAKSKERRGEEKKRKGEMPVF